MPAATIAGSLVSVLVFGRLSLKIKPRSHIAMYRGFRLLIRIQIKWLSWCFMMHAAIFSCFSYPYSLIQTILSALESHQIMHHCARAIPPVGNHTPPRVNIYLLIIQLYFSTIVFVCQVFHQSSICNIFPQTSICDNTSPILPLMTISA